MSGLIQVFNLQRSLLRPALLLLAFTSLFTVSSLAAAQSLQDVKAQGLVGEQSDGYLGFVVNSVPAAVRTLVQEINQERRERYQQIARDNGLTMEQVTAVAYKRAVEATLPGHFVQLPSGEWVRK